MASDESLSFLFESEQMNEILDALGFIHQKTTNQTQLGLAFIEELMNKMKTNGPPKNWFEPTYESVYSNKNKNAFMHLKQGEI